MLGIETAVLSKNEGSDTFPFYTLTMYRILNIEFHICLVTFNSILTLLNAVLVINEVGMHIFECYLSYY